MKSLRQQMFEAYNVVAWAQKALARQPERRYNYLLQQARAFYEKEWWFALGVVFGFLKEKLGLEKEALLLAVIHPPGPHTLGRLNKGIQEGNKGNKRG